MPSGCLLHTPDIYTLPAANLRLEPFCPRTFASAFVSQATATWRQMDGGAERARGAGDLHTRTNDVHRRWGSVFWRSWARVIRGRLPVIGQPNAVILHHGPPPAYVRARPSAQPVTAGAPSLAWCAGQRGGRPVSGARRAGGYRLSRLCSGFRTVIVR